MRLMLDEPIVGVGTAASGATSCSGPGLAAGTGPGPAAGTHMQRTDAQSQGGRHDEAEEAQEAVMAEGKAAKRSRSTEGSTDGTAAQEGPQEGPPEAKAPRKTSTTAAAASSSSSSKQCREPSPPPPVQPTPATPPPEKASRRQLSQPISQRNQSPLAPGSVPRRAKREMDAVGSVKHEALNGVHVKGVRVGFSGFTDETRTQLSSTLRLLKGGIEETADVSGCTHLVVEQPLKRTVKLCVAISLCVASSRSSERWRCSTLLFNSAAPSRLLFSPRARRTHRLVAGLRSRL